ncbi:MAG: hypothetical protein ABI643_00520 [Candidatus Doudnabacteria bacterium]
MTEIGNSQPPPLELGPHKSWFARHIMSEILGILLFGAIAAGAYYYQVSQSEPVIIPPVHHEKVDTMANWKTYTNDQYGFSFKYPNDSTMSSEASPTSSIPVVSFKDPSNRFKLQIESNCCREGTIKYQEFPVLVDGKNLGYRLYGYGENLGATAIDPNNTARIAILIIPASLLKNVDLLNEGIDIELLFSVKDQGEAIKIFQQILSTFKFTVANTVFCGGIAGMPCPTTGYTCVSEGSFPDAGINCTKQITPISDPKNPIACIQVITTGMNPATGEVKTFPTPCDLPPGWVKVEGVSR